jgi:hypothetical protein
MTGNTATDCKVRFLVTSHGWSGSTWLATVLNRHPDIICTHSVGSIDPEATNRNQVDLARQGLTTGRTDMTLEEHFASIESTGEARAYGSVHRYRLRDLPGLSQEGSFDFPFQLANLIRHPVNLVASGHGEFTTLAEVDPYTRFEILQFFMHEHEYYEFLKEKYSLDLTHWGTMAFLAATLHMFVLVHDAACVDGVMHLPMERLTRDPDFLRQVVAGLTSGAVVLDDEFLDGAVDLGPVNSHRSGPSLDAADQFEAWEEWQREAFSHFMVKSEIDVLYAGYGYDFSFVPR